MSTIGTLLAILIGAYWLFLLLKWSWHGFDGVMTFIYSRLPERATTDDADSYDMSSSDDDEYPVVSSHAPNRQSDDVQNAEPAITRHNIPKTQIEAIYKCGAKGITAWELLGCMNHEPQHIKACLEGDRIARSTLARAMGGTYDDELRYLRSVVPMIEEVRPKISIVTMNEITEEG